MGAVRATKTASSEIKCDAEGIVVASARAEIVALSTTLPIAAITEDVVHAAHGCARIDLVQALAQLLDPRGTWLGIEVACQDDGVTPVGVSGDDTHDVVCRGRAGAAATGAHRQRTMVV
eukprot:CAMPEP_0183500692 /NCGR_PEP_ID=MMETSP0371-20130417/2737_1 /TAXON_ID=268820 /ORGANISM="Peridinium aciculiferum, Strain PAER-2" /LENGTH=118 /DNA_ID=CAMNT_0025694873 /DNA_START=410 /DNA_END=762 /DNA_ORIENTATION=-